MTGRLRVIAAVVAMAAIGAAAALDRPTAGDASAPSAVRLPPTSVDRVCPDTNATPAGPVVTSVALVSEPGSGTDLTARAAELSGDGHNRRLDFVHQAAALTADDSRNAVAIHARGSAAAYLVADDRRLVPNGRSRGLLSVPCDLPGTDWWLTGAEGRVGYTDLLVITNPGTTTANVSVSGWAKSGALDLPRLQGLTIRAGRSVVLPVGDFAPDESLVSLRVRANTGQVTADILDRRTNGLDPAGIDWIPPTQPPGTSVVVPGFPAGTGPRTLIVTNPGSVDATVGLQITTGHSSFAPAGHPDVVVRAHRSVAIDLTTSLAEAAGAVSLDSDQPIVAAGLTKDVPDFPRKQVPDIQWQPAAAPIDGPAGIANNHPPFADTSRIYLCAPGQAGRVLVTMIGGRAETVTVPAGRLVSVDVMDLQPSGRAGIRFEPVDGGPVYVSRTLYADGDHGPLLSAEQPQPIPRAALLPAVRPDLRAAIG